MKSQSMKSQERGTKSLPEKAPTKTARKRAYVKPEVEPAGSVFNRTGALGSGTKDGLTGSTLL